MKMGINRKRLVAKKATQKKHSQGHCKRHCDCSVEPLRYPRINEVFDKHLTELEKVVHAMWAEGTAHLNIQQTKIWTNRIQTVGDQLLVLLRDLEYPNHHVLHERLVKSGFYPPGKEPNLG